jgi:hypothetical protein
MDSVRYGVEYGLLLAVDTSFFRWHGWRPEWLQRRFVWHALSGPIIPCASVPSELDWQALHLAQQEYPDRNLYLKLRSHYSPWSGTRFYYQVSSDEREVG